MAGIMTAMDIRIALVCLVVFSVSVAITRYVSLGSILISVVFFAGIVMFGRLGSYEVDAAHYPELCAVSAFLMCLAVWRHRSNIGGCLRGQRISSARRKPENARQGKRCRKRWKTGRECRKNRRRKTGAKDAGKANEREKREKGTETAERGRRCDGSRCHRIRYLGNGDCAASRKKRMRGYALVGDQGRNRGNEEDGTS